MPPTHAAPRRQPPSGCEPLSVEGPSFPEDTYLEAFEFRKTVAPAQREGRVGASAVESTVVPPRSEPDGR